MSGAARRYYESVVGRWAGAYTFAITDAVAFRACAMPFVDRRRLASMPSSGPFTMATSVAFGGGAEVVHTTRVSKWGVTLFRSVESIQLDDDGRSFVLRSTQRFFPAPWSARDFGEARGEVNETSDGATYRIPWIGGVEMIQRTRMLADGLLLVQQTPWSRAEVTLRRG